MEPPNLPLLSIVPGADDDSKDSNIDHLIIFIVLVYIVIVVTFANFISQRLGIHIMIVILLSIVFPPLFPLMLIASIFIDRSESQHSRRIRSDYGEARGPLPAEQLASPPPGRFPSSPPGDLYDDRYDGRR